MLAERTLNLLSCRSHMHHSLQTNSSCSNLLSHVSNGDIRTLLEHGNYRTIDRYDKEHSNSPPASVEAQFSGLLSRPWPPKYMSLCPSRLRMHLCLCTRPYTCSSDQSWPPELLAECIFYALQVMTRTI